MAPGAITPQQALESLGSIKEYRERLTMQAAGIVWMVWGLVITVCGLAAVYGNAQMVDGGKEAVMALWALAICGGALVTNAVLRMQALEARGPAAWIPYAVGAGALAAVVLLDTGVVELARHGFGLARTHKALGFGSYNLLPAAGALAIAYLQRRRVAPTLGYVVAAAFLALYVVAVFSPGGPGPASGFFWSSLWLGLGLVVYLGVGLRTCVRG
jgi:hypothetical protein